jgi:sec-independent protein translocase protein TatA
VIGDILQPTHLLFVLVVALLVLGPKRLPEVGRSLGRGLRDFRSALSGEEPQNESITPPVEDAPLAAVAVTHPAPPAEDAPPVADVAPHPAPPAADVAPHPAPPAADVAPHPAPPADEGTDHGESPPDAAEEAPPPVASKPTS